MSILAIDVGGANLKAADGAGYADSRSFALWRAPERLASETAALLAAAPACQRIVATMTGELADCFESKAAGVLAITQALETAAAGRTVQIYLTNGQFVSPALAAERPLLAAASNWHALATFAIRMATAFPAVLLDMGSTTTDVIPLAAAGPAAEGTTDPERLRSGELVYTGVDRTPVCAMVSQLSWQGQSSPIAAELFATAADAYTLLGDVDEDPQCCETADGKPRTKQNCRARLARMVCADVSQFSDDDALAAAAAIRTAQLRAVEAGLTQVVSQLVELPTTLVLSGQGEFFLRQLIARSPWRDVEHVVSLTELLGPEVSRCATAYALAVLALERFGERDGR